MPRLFHFVTFSPSPRALSYYFIIQVQLIASAVSGSAVVLHSTVLSFTGTFIWLIWIILMLLVVLPQTGHFLNKQIQLIKRGAKIIFFTLLILGLAELLIFTSFNMILNRHDNTRISRLLSSFSAGFNYNDSTAIIHQATINLLEGKNPYSSADIAQAIVDFKVPLDRITMVRAGKFLNMFPYPTETQVQQIQQEAYQSPGQTPTEIENKLSYPPGSFLIPAIFFKMGISDLRIVYFLIVLAAMLYAVYLLPSPNRFIFIGASLISLDIWNSIANGETGSLVFAFLLLAWVLVNRQLWLSAIFMGIAVITKQTAWFFLPFYLILIYKNKGLKRASMMISIIAAIFLVANLHFMIEGCKMWFSSLFAPMSANMFPDGIGPITLVTSSVLNIRSPLIFDIIEFFVLAGGIVWYFIYYYRYRFLGPFLATLPLFFAWRSLSPYFFYTGIIILASILLDVHPEKLPPKLEAVSNATN